MVCWATQSFSISDRLTTFFRSSAVRGLPRQRTRSPAIRLSFNTWRAASRAVSVCRWVSVMAVISSSDLMRRSGKKGSGRVVTLTPFSLGGGAVLGGEGRRHGARRDPVGLQEHTHRVDQVGGLPALAGFPLVL